MEKAAAGGAQGATGTGSSQEDEEVVDATTDDKEGWLATHLDGELCSFVGGEHASSNALILRASTGRKIPTLVPLLIALHPIPRTR